jgi:hypothetical protein
MTRHLPTEVREDTVPEVPRRTRPADKRRRFPEPKRPVSDDGAFPLETPDARERRSS